MVWLSNLSSAVPPCDSIAKPPGLRPCSYGPCTLPVYRGVWMPCSPLPRVGPLLFKQLSLVIPSPSNGDVVDKPWLSCHSGHSPFRGSVWHSGHQSRNKDRALSDILQGLSVVLPLTQECKVWGDFMSPGGHLVSMGIHARLRVWLISRSFAAAEPRKFVGCSHPCSLKPLWLWESNRAIG